MAGTFGSGIASSGASTGCNRPANPLPITRRVLGTQRLRAPSITSAESAPVVRGYWQVMGNCAPTLPPLELGIVPVMVWPTVSVSSTDWPPTEAPKSQ